MKENPNKENTFSFEERKENVKTDMKYNDKNNRERKMKI